MNELSNAIIGMGLAIVAVLFFGIMVISGALIEISEKLGKDEEEE